MLATDDKKRLRAEAKARRAAAHGECAGDAADAVCAHFVAALADMRMPSPGAVIAGYWPMRDELDVRPLMHELHARRYDCALPAVIGLGAPLEFRRWRPAIALEAGVRGTRHPPAGSARLTPRIVLVPLLAFDDNGFRLGYGAGLYDRTLAALRAGASLLAVGIGFAAQRIERLPRAPHDEPLDRVVTEAGVIRMS